MANQTKIVFAKPSENGGAKFKYWRFSSPLTRATLLYKLRLLSAPSPVTLVDGDLSQVWSLPDIVRDRRNIVVLESNSSAVIDKYMKVAEG